MKTIGIQTFIAVFALWFAIYIPFLGKIELQGNEARRILPAMTMLETGDWITPELADQAYYKKPPLINWLVAAAFKLRGNTAEGSARMVSTLFTLLLAMSILFIPSGWLDSKQKTAAALICLTSYGVIVHGRLIEIEATLTALTGIAVIWWLGIAAGGGKSWKLWIPPAFILGLGLLLKGPIILLFYYCTVICVLIYMKRSRELISPAHIIAILIMLAIFAVWAIKMRSLTPASETAQVATTWKAEILDEINPAKIGYAHWGGCIFSALFFIFPWIFLLPILWNKKTLSEIPADKIAFFKGTTLSLAIGFALVNIMPGTEARYSAPLLPLAAILIGFALPLREIPILNKTWGIVLKILNYLLISLIALSAIFIYSGRLLKILHSIREIDRQMLFGLEPANFALAAVMLLIAAAISFLFVKMMKKSSDTITLATGTAMQCALVMIFFYILVIPLAGVFAKKKYFAREINRSVPENQMLQILDVGYQPYLYYIRDPKINIYSFSSVDDKSEYVIMTEPTYDDMMNNIRRKPEVYNGRKPVVISTLKYKRESYKIVKMTAPLM